MRVGPGIHAHAQQQAHSAPPLEAVPVEMEAVPPAPATEAGASNGHGAGAGTGAQHHEAASQRLADKIASGHFNDVAAMRLRLHLAATAPEVEARLPDAPTETDQPGHGFERALAAYRAAVPALDVADTAGAEVVDILPTDTGDSLVDSVDVLPTEAEGAA